MNGDLITVRPWEQEPRWINILVEDCLGRQKQLAIREDARTSTLRSQYDALTGYEAGYLNFSFKGISLMNEQQLHTVCTSHLLWATRLNRIQSGIREGSCVEVHREGSEFAAPSCPPTSPSLFASSRVLSNSYVPAAGYSGWDYTPCRRSRRWNESGWD